MNFTTKRWLFLAILLVALIGIICTIYFLFWKPNQKERALAPTPQTQAQEPLPQAGTLDPLVFKKPTTPAPAPDSPEEQERKAREALFRRARDLTSRAATFSNADGFQAITQVYTDASSDMQAFLEEERKRLAEAHATLALPYVQTTRGLTAKLVQDVDVRSATAVQVEVEVQQRIEDGTNVSTKQRKVVLDLAKQGELWLLTRLTWD